MHKVLGVLQGNGCLGLSPPEAGLLKERSPVRTHTLSVWQNSWLDLFLPICLSWYERDLQRGVLQLAGCGLKPPVFSFAVQWLTFPHRLACRRWGP